MLRKRILSALVFVPLLLVLMVLGGWFWLLAVMALVVLGLHEYCNLLKIKDVELPFGIMAISGALMVLIQNSANSSLDSISLLVAVILLVLWVLWKKVDFSSLIYGIGGIVLIGWTLSALIGIWHIDNSWQLVLLTFLIPWLTDTGAYFVGCTIGKHKLAPEISPKKSWEGAIGGLVIGVLVVIIYNLVILHYPMWIMILIGFIGSVVGQIGDLIESWLKRWVGVKDAGNTIPGHGGILDRFDSMLLVAPVVYYILLLYNSFMV